MKRIISTLLAVLMLVSGLVITVGAEDSTEETAPVYTYNTTNTAATIDYLKGTTIPAEEGAEGVKITSAEEKLATMDLRLEKDGYRLYVDAYSGEIATYCIATGETLFTNPYTVCDTIPTSGKEAHDTVKKKLLSQLVVKYTDVATGQSTEYYSYEWAAERGQIDVKNIKNGIRVEYTIGREEARMLVPRQIEKTAFETKILAVLDEALTTTDDNGVVTPGSSSFWYGKVKSYYTLKDPDAAVTEEAKKQMQSEFPITKKMDVYVLDSSAASTEIAKLEELIKTYVPSYTYEDLDEDHLLTEYQSQDENPPLFKMALEYTLDKYGVSVRLPANGIRFNESLYQLYSIEILPYMGAGTNPNSGYTFFPDGSGTLFDFEKLQDLGTTTAVTGKVYGQDYAYHDISGTHQEIIRYPVFGIKETETFVTEAASDGAVSGGDSAVAVAAEDSETAGTEGTVDTEEEVETITTEKDRGFIAIVEEGDALMELSAYHAISTDPYNTVKMIVYPRPQDSYNIADAISVGTNDEWTVVSSRKYTGNYTVRYIMLTDPDVAAEREVEDYYDCSYVGMAQAYRDYLVDKGVLTKLTEEDVEEDIPLYIETFGAVETTKKILSIPVNTMAPLTSFENIQTMYNELNAEGISNINFILTGYTKGGLSEASVPYNLKWESAVGGKSGFEDLIAFAKEKGIGIFPDFDFVFISNNSMFDGLSLKSHAVKTIDNRYTSKRVYSATKQTYISYYELAISPAYFDRFYTKLTENYLEYDPIGISVSTLGSYLNSDFDEDEPYNREDSKEFTVNAFEYLSENYNGVMTSGGNAYTWKYVDYITDIALDSSRYSQASASIPFLGMVLHGYVQIAGTPINMEGNIDYALLKAIENGASLNFILSYQNTDLLKESETLSQYYSVRYDIWFEDVVSIYNELNSVLKDVQTSAIVAHTFIPGERVPDDDELLADARAAVEEAVRIEDELAEASSTEAIDKLLEARKGIKNQITVELPKYLSNTEDNNIILVNKDFEGTLNTYNNAKSAYDDANALVAAKQTAVNTLKEELAQLEANSGSADDIAAKKTEIANAEKELSDAETALKNPRADYIEALTALRKIVDSIYVDANNVATAAYNATSAYDKAIEYLEYLKENSNYSDEMIADLEAIIYPTDPSASDPKDSYDRAKEIADSAKALADDVYNRVKDIDGIEVEPYEVVLNLPKAEDAAGDTDNDKNTVHKYDSDENKIALVTYENGTSFILNFNNYDVTTEVDGVVYTVSAYGYVVLKK